MKKLLIFVLASVGIISLQSCNEEVELAGDFVETAVVYGLLDPAEDVHMIKINRAFIGPGNSLDIAQIPDSNYFESVVATITEEGGLNRVWTLMDTTVDNKDESGVFFAPTQKLYFFTTPSNQPLDGSATYHLNIVVNGGEFEVNGETQLVTNLSSTVVQGQGFRFSFSDDPGEYISDVFQVTTGTAAIINATLRVNYKERINGVFENKSFQWELGEVPADPNKPLEAINFTASGQTFYNLVRNACEGGDPLVDRRNITSFDVILTGGSQDLYNYILVNEPTSSLAQNKPTFTNLTATNDHPVVGIFSGRTTVSYNKPAYISGQPYVRVIDQKSTSELCIGPITGSYLFCSDHPADNGETYDCN